MLGELEVWPNLIKQCSKRKIPVCVVNGRLSENSFRGYQRFGWLLKSTFERINLVACQTDEYAERFRSLGCRSDSVITTGSIKFDDAKTDRANEKTRHLFELARFSSEDHIFLAGSTQRPEEQMAIDAYRAAIARHPDKQCKLILVPRHPERFVEVFELAQRSEFTVQRRTELNAAKSSENSTADILVVDTIGELGAWWGTAHVGFVGGSFGSRGGQNMIEPAAYGVATCFGPNTSNFKDVVELLLKNVAAVRVETADELTEFVCEMIGSVDSRKKLGDSAKKLVASQTGATQKTIDQLKAILNLN